MKRNFFGAHQVEKKLSAEVFSCWAHSRSDPIAIEVILQCQGTVYRCTGGKVYCTLYKPLEDVIVRYMVPMYKCTCDSEPCTL